MKKEEYETIYNRKWDSDTSPVDRYSDETGENTVGFPGIDMPVITIENPEIIQEYQFGFIPPWSKPELLNEVRNTFNARIETIAELPTWRDAWNKGQRCLVCTNGFYEFDKKSKKRIFIHLKKEEHFFFGGIYGHYLNRTTGDIIRSMAVITTTANDLVATVHHRMPVIIRPGDESIWMDPESDPQNLLLQYGQPYSDAFMVMEQADMKLKPPNRKNNQGELF